MSFKPCADASAAGWIASSPVPWGRLVSFGPDVFPSHARLRFIPDPTRTGQSESEAAPGPMDELSETKQLEIAAGELLRHTSTPEDLFIAYWDGYGMDMPAAMFEVPNRSFFLYRGRVSDTGAFVIAEEDQGPSQQWLPAPAFIWPADHAWCIAHDVDPHWAGIGAGQDAIAELLRTDRLDVVPANPEAPQPAYY